MCHCLSVKLSNNVENNECFTMCNFVGCIKKAKKHGLKRIKILGQSIECHAETLKLTLSQLLLISTFVSLQDDKWRIYCMNFLLDTYRLKYGDSFPPGSELHSTRFSPENSAYSNFNLKGTIRSPSTSLHIFVSCIFR